MVANGINIELKAAANSENSRSAHWLIVDFKDHPIYDRLHLFVFSYNKSILRRAREEPQYGWMVMVSRKTPIPLPERRAMSP